MNQFKEVSYTMRKALITIVLTALALDLLIVLAFTAANKWAN